MPSHAPLSSRDGRIRTSSVHQGGEPFYYSNEEIELLHEVVALAQEILPTLPKRDKLPNTALFRAADIIFPRYGVDPDADDKLNRIIFMVGGMRSSNSLLDRFRTVLGGMGIELEYVPDPDDRDIRNHNGEPDAHPINTQPHGRRRSDVRASSPSSQPPSPRISVYSAAPSSTDGIFPVAHHVNGRRRHNSDSIAELVAAAAEGRFDLGRRQHSQQQQPDRALEDQHHHQESDLLAVPLRNYKEHFDLQNESRLPQPQPPTRDQHSHKTPHIDPWLSQVPSYSAAIDKDEHAHSLEKVQCAKVGQEESGLGKELPIVDDYTHSLDVLLASTLQRHYNQQEKKVHSGSVDTVPARHDHDRQYIQQLPIRTRSTGPVPDTSSCSAHSSPQHAGSSTEPQSPRSRASSLVTDQGLKGASDTTIQEEWESEPAPKVDPLIMAKVADTFFMRIAFLGGIAIDAWRTMTVAHLEQEQYAARVDRELCLSETLADWSRLAAAQVDYAGRKFESGPLLVPLQISHHPRTSRPHTAPKQQELEAPESQYVDEAIAAEDDESDDETAVQYRQKQDERDRLMQRAARVYAITTIFNGVMHWHAMAREEVSRTKVARRHLLRRKVFGAWRDQMNAEYVKADRITLNRAFHRWTSALHAIQDENAQLAVQYDRRNLVIGAAWTWFRTHQEKIAENWASNLLKRKAIASWRQSAIAAASAEATALHMRQKSLVLTASARWFEQTEIQIHTFLSIEEHENETYTRAALQDWSKEALCQRQLRAIQSAHESRIKATALLNLRESTNESRHRAFQLDLDIVEECTTHWRCETRLALFRADYEHDLKADAIHSWVLAEKLAFYIRYRDERLLRKTCLALAANYGSRQPGQRGEQEREIELARTADRLIKSNAALRLLSAFRGSKEKRGALGQIAEYLDHEAMATTSLGLWTAAVVERGATEKMALRGAFYVGTANALSGWAAYAQKVRKERLRTAYRMFRRDMKRQTAARHLARWRNAALRQGSEFHGSGAYATADQLYYPHTIFTALNHWILETNDCLFQQNVAAEADAEVYLSRWRLQLVEGKELGAAAAEHDTITQLAGRWDNWELQAVQAQAREHTASTLLEKNDRRLGRRVLAVWQQGLVDRLHLGLVNPEEDLRISLASPPDRRWRGDELRGSNVGGYSASLGYGSYPRAGFGLRRLGASLSSPLEEVKIAHRPAQMARPASSTVPMTNEDGPFHERIGLDAPRGEAVPQPPHPPSSGTKQLRRLQRSTSTAPYRQVEQRDVREARQPTPYRVPSSPENTVTPARPLPYSHRLLQRRLQSATQLANSVQLGPMSEFDEVEAVEEAELGGNDPTLKDYDDADVSSEEDEILDLDPDNNLVVPVAGDQHELMYSNAPHTLDTPTRPFSRPESIDRVTVPLSSSSQRLLPIQLHSKLRFAAPTGTATPVNNGGLNPNVNNSSVAGDRRLASFRPDFSMLRKSVIVGAAAASGAAYSSFADQVTTTPMGPLSSPFERRLRAAYDEGSRQGKSGDKLYNNEDYYKGQHANLATVTPLRQLPLRASLADSTATARPGARVSFVEKDRGQGDDRP
ncbi:hypothetical protein SEPCBS119000_004353 [Sporothrix epigloea]|uniref:Sfi1 spindle body domain-containing protein n=1 Tax=Sporothrix epigloea TaxID=1892477 RepID=A0ABP0DVJ4_9PEZI